MLLEFASVLLTTTVVPVPALAAPEPDPPIQAPTFESFEASLMHPLRIALVSNHRRLDIDVLGEVAKQIAEDRRGLCAIDAREKWSSRTIAAMDALATDFAIVVDDVTIKKGKTKTKEFTSLGTKAKPTKIKYVGALVTVELDVFAPGPSGRWTKLTTWSVEYDRRDPPRLLSLDSVKGSKLEIDVDRVVRFAVTDGLLSGVKAAQSNSIDAPLDSMVEWATRLDAPAELEFWRRASTLVEHSAPLDRRGLDALAIRRWRELEERSENQPELVELLCIYLRSPSVRWSSWEEAEESVRHRIESAEKKKLVRITDKGRKPSRAVYVHENVAERIDLTRSRMPRLLHERIVVFGDADRSGTKARFGKRDFLKPSDGAILVTEVGYEHVVSAVIDEDDVSIERVEEALAGPLSWRWPRDSRSREAGFTEVGR